MHGNLSHSLNIPSLPKSWTVLQDIAPIADHGGHLLIMPNRHRISLASVEDQEELSLATDSVVDFLRQHFNKNPIFFFEHGPGIIDEQQTACAGNNPYLHVGMMTLQSVESLTYVQRLASQKLESQLMRRIISSVVYGLPSSQFWHWRDIVEGFVSVENTEKIKQNVIEFRRITGV